MAVNWEMIAMQQPLAMKQPEPIGKRTFGEVFIDFLKSESKEGLSATTTIAGVFGLATFFLLSMVALPDERMRGIASIGAAAAAGVGSSVARFYLKRRN